MESGERGEQRFSTTMVEFLNISYLQKAKVLSRQKEHCTIGTQVLPLTYLQSVLQHTSKGVELMSHVTTLVSNVTMLVYHLLLLTPLPQTSKRTEWDN